MSEENNTPGTEDAKEAPWQSTLPEQLQSAPFFKAAESLDDALSQLNNAASHMGNSVRVPSEDASAEDQAKYTQKVLEKFPGLMPKPDEANMGQFYDSLGRPKESQNYRYDLPEGKEVPDDFQNFRDVAHKAGLTQDQFKEVLSGILGPVFEGQEVVESEHKEAMEALASEWGFAYNNNITAVKNFLDLTDAPQGIQDLIENGAMSPEEIRWLHGIAKQNGDPKELAQQRGKPDPGLSPADAMDQIQDIMNNSDHPYWNATDPRHKDAIKKMIDLHRMAKPSR